MKQYLFYVFGSLIVAWAMTASAELMTDMYMPNKLVVFNKWQCPRNINTYYVDEEARSKTPEKEPWCNLPLEHGRLF